VISASKLWRVLHSSHQIAPGEQAQYVCCFPLELMKHSVEEMWSWQSPFPTQDFFARSRMRRESFGLDSVLGLRWGRCSTFITKKRNGIPLWVLSVYSWKVLSCCICSHSIKLAIFPWAHVVLIHRHMIMNIVMNTAFTCTEAIQVLSAWREDAIWLLNLCVQFEFILSFIQKARAGGVASFHFRARLCVTIHAIQWPRIMNTTYLLGMEHT
jgi:hypothetical protein